MSNNMRLVCIMNPMEFKDMVTRGGFIYRKRYASPEWLMCVNFEVTEDSITCMSTDRASAAISTVYLATNLKEGDRVPFSFTIHGKMLDAVLQLIDVTYKMKHPEGEEHGLQIYETNKEIIFKRFDMEFECSKIFTRYPNVRRLINDVKNGGCSATDYIHLNKSVLMRILQAYKGYDNRIFMTYSKEKSALLIECQSSMALLAELEHAA